MSFSTATHMHALHDKINPSDRFIIKDLIADTLQGRIYYAMDKLNNTPVAIKETWKALVQLKQCRQGTKIRENYLNEINILKHLSQSLDCPSSIIRILSSWDDKQCYMYAMEYCDCCLFNYIKKMHKKGCMKFYCDAMQQLPQRSMSYTESIKNPFLKYVQRVFIKLTQCISYIHSKGIVHMDLSLENIMLYNFKNDHIHNPCIKLIDFGLSKYFDDGSNFVTNERCGKLSYMAPEVFMHNKCYDARSADIWSMGIILFVLLIGTHLVDKPSIDDSAFHCLMTKGVTSVLKKWKRLRLINEDTLDLMNNIFQFEANRMSMEQLLNHEFLNPNRYCIYEDMDEVTPTPSTVCSMHIDDDFKIELFDDESEDKGIVSEGQIDH